MKNKEFVIKLLISLSIFLISAVSYCQILSPLELSKEIFTNRNFKDIDKHSIGEYKGIPKAKDFSKTFKLKFKLLNENDSLAYVNMTILDSTELSGTDTYLFLVKDTVWKISAFRALAKTGLMRKTLADYGGMNETQIDSLIEIEKTSIHPNFSSRIEFKYLIDNIKLTLALDDTIIKHFIDNKQRFELLKNKSLEYIQNNKADENKVEEQILGLENDFKPLLITSIYYDVESPCQIKFSIGGILDNNVGYLYIGNRCKLPIMAPNSFILLREIGEGWYLYKTT